MSAALRLVLVLSFAAIAIAAFVLYLVRLGLGLAAGFDGAAVLCLVASYGALQLGFMRAEA